MWTRVLGQALLPLNLTLEALFLAIVLRRFRRRRLAAWVLSLGLLVLLLASSPVVADALVRGLEREWAPVAVDASPTADAIVVLGGALGPARPPRLSPDLSDGADRVLHAARLYRAKRAPLVVASGGSGPGGGADAPESRDIADLLVEWGVPREAIVEEASSGDTHQNAVETLRILEARGLNRVLLVTSAMHMGRARAAFAHAGLDVVPSPTDFLSIEPAERTVLDWLPDAGALALSSAASHEWLGRLWYRIRGWE